MKIDRLLGIIVTLLNKKRISARELADKYEVTTRTIYRDMESINAAGIPIISYQGINGGWGIMENYRLDKQVLSFEDMSSLIITLTGVNKSISNKNIDSIIQKITSLIPSDKNDLLRKQEEEFAIDINSWVPVSQIEIKLFKEIQSAISDKFLINFYYDNLQNEVTNRTIEPMTLIFKGYAWYLFAYCRLKNDFRIFKLSRIQDLKIINEHFIRKKETYESHVGFISDKTKLLEVELKFKPELKNKVSEYFRNFMSISAEDGSIYIKIKLPSDEWIYGMILSYGDGVEVLSPAEIRSEIYARITKMERLYKYDTVLSD